MQVSFHDPEGYLLATGNQVWSCENVQICLVIIFHSISINFIFIISFAAAWLPQGHLLATDNQVL